MKIEFTSLFSIFTLKCHNLKSVPVLLTDIINPDNWMTMESAKFKNVDLYAFPLADYSTQVKSVCGKSGKDPYKHMDNVILTTRAERDYIIKSLSVHSDDYNKILDKYHKKMDKLNKRSNRDQDDE